METSERVITLLHLMCFMMSCVLDTTPFSSFCVSRAADHAHTATKHISLHRRLVRAAASALQSAGQACQQSLSAKNNKCQQRTTWNPHACQQRTTMCSFQNLKTRRRYCYLRGPRDTKTTKNLSNPHACQQIIGANGRRPRRT